jgi:hypothetical protein
LPLFAVFFERSVEMKEPRFPVVLPSFAMRRPITKAEADAWMLSEIGRLPERPVAAERKDAE